MEVPLQIPIYLFFIYFIYKWYNVIIDLNQCTPFTTGPRAYSLFKLTAIDQIGKKKRKPKTSWGLKQARLQKISKNATLYIVCALTIFTEVWTLQQYWFGQYENSGHIYLTIQISLPLVS